MVLLWSFFFPTCVLSQQNASENDKKIRFSGFANLNTNGISPVPAFSLNKASLIGVLSLAKGRTDFNTEWGFSLEGKPWYINPKISITAIKKERFDFTLSGIYSFSFSYPEILVEGITKVNQQLDHYALAQTYTHYNLSKRTSISLTTFHGFGLGDAPIRRGNFLILGLLADRMRITSQWFYTLNPQVTYINLDGETQGAFLSVVLGLGHKKLPLVLSSQWVQPIASNISPSPVLAWNVGLSYFFSLD